MVENELTTQQLWNLCSRRIPQYLRVNPVDDSGMPVGSAENPLHVTGSESVSVTPYLLSGAEVDVLPKTETKIFELTWPSAGTELRVLALRCVGQTQAKFRLVSGAYAETAFSMPGSNTYSFEYGQLLRLNSTEKIEVYCRHSYYTALKFQAVLIGGTTIV